MSYLRPSTGALLSIAVLSLLAAGTGYAHAQNAVIASSVGFETTSIIEFENLGSADVEKIRLWLGSDASFKSFKAEKGWTGAKSEQGLLSFTTAIPIKSGETAKFGVKTDSENPGINWKALDAKNTELGAGKTFVAEAPKNINGKNPPKAPPPIAQDGAGVLPDSIFRLVPEKPNVGSNVRVAGDGFGANQKLSLYMSDKMLSSFSTDGAGSFVITSKIPDNEAADRVDFVVKDEKGNEKEFSLRLGAQPEDKRTDEVVKLGISEFPDTIQRGQAVTVKGTGNPGSSITATITDPEGEVVTTTGAEVGLDGRWIYETLVAADAKLGRYSAVITDGKTDLVKTWEIESDQKIHLESTRAKFDPGMPVIFNGTAIPNETLEVIIENPQGTEVFSDIIQVNETGFVEFEFPTTFADPEGTYVVFAIQQDHAAISIFGLGQLPAPRPIVKADKLNYVAGDIARLAIEGLPSSTITMIIVDPSDNQKFTDSIKLNPDGKKEYELDLDGYKSGVYSIVLARGGAQTGEVFSVGLITGSGPITIKTTKTEYVPGDPILVLGDSGANILVTLTLIDPSGNAVKVKESFTNKEGKISVDSFRVPSDAASGIWTINVKSGAHFDNVEFDVIPGIVDGLAVVLEDIKNESSLGKILQFRVLGATHSLNIKFFTDSGELIDTILPPGKSDDYSSLWKIPSDLESGTYLLVATDGTNSANATFAYDHNKKY